MFVFFSACGIFVSFSSAVVGGGDWVNKESIQQGISDFHFDRIPFALEVPVRKEALKKTPHVKNVR